MTRTQYLGVVLGFLLISVSLRGGDPAFEGRWRLDTTRSTALDGWTAMDLLVSVEGSEVALQHDMRWRQTRVVAVNRVDTAASTEILDFFRVDQRHMAVYPLRGSRTRVVASWLDDGQTLRVAAWPKVETSQGTSTIRIVQEYRIEEGGDTLTLIELHSTRNRPLVYVFRKLPADDSSRP